MSVRRNVHLIAAEAGSEHAAELVPALCEAGHLVRAHVLHHEPKLISAKIDAQQRTRRGRFRESEIKVDLHCGRSR